MVKTLERFCFKMKIFVKAPLTLYACTIQENLIWNLFNLSNFTFHAYCSIPFIKHSETVKANCFFKWFILSTLAFLLLNNIWKICKYVNLSRITQYIAFIRIARLPVFLLIDVIILFYKRAITPDLLNRC